jgi:hypothetical protein
VPSHPVFQYLESDHFSWAADRSTGGDKSWVKDVRRIEAKRIAPGRSLGSHAALLFLRWRYNVMERLPFRANLAEYSRQADAVLSGWNAGDESAIRFLWEQHPRFRRPDVLWLPKQMETVDI